MPRLTIDNLPIDVPAGSSILDAARRLGLDIPALCWHEGYRPATSCMLCVVRIHDGGRLVPSCATPAEDGMVVQSQTPEIHALRRAGLELLLSDHAGDCLGPCELACPLGIDLPVMLRQVSSGDWSGAIATVRAGLALAGVVSRLCAGFCENACRRGQADGAAATRQVEQYVVDRDRVSGTSYVPACRPSSGKRVAVVGAGPAGLSAAYHLQMEGHACTMFDARQTAGGHLREQTTAEPVPSDVLDAEIALIERMGVQFELGVRIGANISLVELRDSYDAVLLAPGAESPREWLAPLVSSQGELQVDAHTQATVMPGVFAAGDAVRAGRPIVRVVAEGKQAARAIDAYLRTGQAQPAVRSIVSRLGRLTADELTALLGEASPARQMDAPSDYGAAPSDEQLQTEAGRCLHCDCASKDACKLRYYARIYGAVPNRFRGERRHAGRTLRSAGVVYEPGKCILCGLCVQAAESASEACGLAFIGRGFDVQVGVPFDRTLDEALRGVAQTCIDICPSGALTRPDGTGHCDGAADACGESCRMKDHLSCGPEEQP